MSIRVVIVEDETLIRESLALVLGLENDIEVVGQSGRGDEIVGLVADSAAEVAILDIDLPGMSGLDGAEALRERGIQCGIVMITSHGRPGYLHRAVRAGVLGFVTKDLSARKLPEAVRTVHSGARYIDPEIAADAIAAGTNPLTPRECHVLRLAGEGRNVKQIASELSLGDGTVRNYVSSAIAKLGAENRVDAHRTATENGWL